MSVSTLAVPKPAQADVSTRVALVRYGAIPEVARFSVQTSSLFLRGDPVVIETHRGVEIGTFLEEVLSASRDGMVSVEPPQTVLVRAAESADLSRHENHRAECNERFPHWCDRIAEWNLQLELIDMEWTLDRSKLILYVLNDRGPECTKLALQAAAAGYGIIEVQPVNATGLVAASGSGGCGSGGCGSGGCGH